MNIRVESSGRGAPQSGPRAKQVYISNGRLVDKALDPRGFGKIEKLARHDDERGGTCSPVSHSD